MGMGVERWMTKWRKAQKGGRRLGGEHKWCDRKKGQESRNDGVEFSPVPVKNWLLGIGPTVRVRK